MNSEREDNMDIERRLKNLTAPRGNDMCYVYHIYRDALMEDLMQKITGDK